MVVLFGLPPPGSTQVLTQNLVIRRGAPLGSTPLGYACRARPWRPQGYTPHSPSPSRPRHRARKPFADQVAPPGSPRYDDDQSVLAALRAGAFSYALKEPDRTRSSRTFGHSLVVRHSSVPGSRGACFSTSAARRLHRLFPSSPSVRPRSWGCWPRGGTTLGAHSMGFSHSHEASRVPIGRPRDPTLVLVAGSAVRSGLRTEVRT